MRIRENLSLRQIADEYIMITDTGDSLDYTQAITLNETAAYLINETVGQEVTAERWADLLEARYEVERVTALADAERLIITMREANILID